MDRTDPGFTVEDAGGIVTITLIRPDRSNALDEPLLGALKRLLEGLIGQSQPRVVVLTGSGRAFCAGADISAIKGMTDKGEIARIFAPQGEVIGSLVGEVAELLFSPRLISIAAVNGSAIGGGWLLALACDFCLAAASARFWFPEVGLGRAVSPTAARVVAMKAGGMAARNILLRASRFTAGDLDGLGLLTAIVTDDALQEETRRIAGGLAASDPVTLSTIKSRIVQ
jgi:enoyl-CoA hydratase/carnithine racemase